MGNRHRIDVPHTRMNWGKEDWIDLEEHEPGVFRIVDDSMSNRRELLEAGTDPDPLGFSPMDEEAKVLDEGSDGFEYLGVSEHIRWKDVEFTPDEFRAPSLERLMEAVKHVFILTWDPQDI